LGYNASIGVCCKGVVIGDYMKSWERLRDLMIVRCCMKNLIRGLIASALIVCCFFVFENSRVLAASTLDWPDNSIVLIPGTPVVHASNGMKLIESAPFIDNHGRTQVPLRLIAEEMGAEVLFENPIVTVRLGNIEVLLELGKNQAVVNGSPVQLDAAPLLRSDRVFVPLRFVAESLDLSAHYLDGVVLAGACQTKPTPEQALSWRQRISSRWVAVRPDWQTYEIGAVNPDLSGQFVFFWRYTSNLTYWLCQSLRSDPDMAFVIVDDFVYDNTLYGTEGMAPIRFGDMLVRPNGYYMMLHSGGASMGGEYLYRFSSDNGAQEIISNQMYGFEITGDYAYFVTASPFGIGSIMRVHIPSALQEEYPLPQAVGQEGFAYGYSYFEDENGRGGSPIGFAIDGDVIYANGFDMDERPIRNALYIIDINTMTHAKLYDGAKLYIQPSILKDWVLFMSPIEGGPQHSLSLFRIQRDGTGCEMLIQNIVGYRVEGGDIVYWRDYDSEKDEYVEVRYQMPNQP